MTYINTPYEEIATEYCKCMDAKAVSKTLGLPPSQVNTAIHYMRSIGVDLPKRNRMVDVDKLNSIVKQVLGEKDAKTS